MKSPKFEALRNFWYYALPGHRLSRGSVLAKTLLGEPLLLGRARDGTAFALRDLCPHRGFPLSYGRFDGREIECCYHGWRFDTAGRCTAIPALVPEDNVELSRIRVASYPCREAQGNIWVFFGDATAAAPGVPVLPDIGDRGSDIVETIRCPVPADYAVLGLLDPAHGPYVHRSWFWRPGGTAHVKTKRFVPTPWGFTMAKHQASANSRAYRILGGPPVVEISFQLPGVRIEHVRVGRHVLINMTCVTPIDADSSETTNCLYWTMPWLTALKPALRVFAKYFLAQDQRAFARHAMGLKFDPPLMMVKDADAQSRWYFQLKAEHARATAEGREFVNPVVETELRWRT